MLETNYSGKSDMTRIVVVVGPTAIGKSALALRLGQDFGGEIISADSRQVYRGLDIGTAKPTPDEQSLVPHHIIDIVNPDQDFSLARYQKLAYKTIDEVADRDHFPILSGGSGLYVRAVLEGWRIPAVAPDKELRKRLEERAASGEAEQLYDELKKLDTDAASRIDQHNIRRVIRALEIRQNLYSNPKPGKIRPPFDFLIIGLTTSREALYRRIDRRVDDMIRHGLVEEVKGLIEKGYSPELPSMSGIGYRQVVAFLHDSDSLEEAVRQIKYESHRLARQQYNWFSPKDDRIHWFDVDASPYGQITSLVGEFLKEQD